MSQIRSTGEIVFQTSILALNAAIEAARGEQAGMSFAAEARDLAQLSSQPVLIAESNALFAADRARLDDVNQAISAIKRIAGQARILVEREGT